MLQQVPVLAFSDFFQCGIFSLCIMFKLYDTDADIEAEMDATMGIYDSIRLYHLDNKEELRDREFTTTMGYVKDNLPHLHEEITAYLKGEDVHLSEYVYKTISY